MLPLLKVWNFAPEPANNDFTYGRLCSSLIPCCAVLVALVRTVNMHSNCELLASTQVAPALTTAPRLLTTVPRLLTTAPRLLTTVTALRPHVLHNNNSDFRLGQSIRHAARRQWCAKRNQRCQWCAKRNQRCLHTVGWFRVCCQQPVPSRQIKDRGWLRAQLCCWWAALARQDRAAHRGQSDAGPGQEVWCRADGLGRGRAL